MIWFAALAGCQPTMPIRPVLTLPSFESLQQSHSETQSESPTHRIDSTILTLTDLEGLALENNPTLRAGVARIESAVGKRVQAGLNPNPVIGYHATEIGNVQTAGQQGGFISQRFITGGKLQLDQEIVDKKVEEARFRLQAQEQRVLSDVRVRFYEALVSQRRVELTQELTRIGEELVKATRKLLKGRLGTDNDLLQAQIRSEEAQILHDNARNEQVEAWRRLTAVIGLPQLAMTPLDGQLDANLPSVDWDTCYTKVLSNNPALLAARAQVKGAEIAIRRAKKEPIPNIDLSVSVRHHNVTGSDVVNVQAGIPIPIFDKNQGNIRSAKAERVHAQKEIERIELYLQDQLAMAYRRFANARQQVTRYGQRIVPRAKKSLALVRTGYDNGQVKYLTLLTAQQTYVQVSLSYLDALRELWASIMVIEGQLLSGSLNKAN